MKFRFLFVIVCTATSLTKCGEKVTAKLKSEESQLLSLEQKWLEAEFSLDTAFLSSIIDPGFIDISSTDVHQKAAAINSMYDNINQRKKDSIFVDSFKIEEPIIKLYENAAVVTFIVHTFRREKGVRSQHKTRFYDVWVRRQNSWKAVSSQGTPIE
jgi:hypothetical protein